MEKNDYLFREMPVRKAVLTLAVPTVVSQLITLVYNLADTFFIGQLDDPRQVAAATVAMPAFIILTALSNLFGIGGASKISRCLGSGDVEGARKTASFAVWTAAAASLLYGLGILLAASVLLPLLGAISMPSWDGAMWRQSTILALNCQAICQASYTFPGRNRTGRIG